MYNVYITFLYSIVISNMVIPFNLPKGGAARTPVRCVELFNTGHDTRDSLKLRSDSTSARFYLFFC